MATVQIVLIALMVLVLALFPPIHGKMILIPVLPEARTGMIARATQLGARLIGNGPLPHSLVVSGDRAALASHMLRRGVLVLAAPPAGCGRGVATRP